MNGVQTHEQDPICPPKSPNVSPKRNPKPNASQTTVTSERYSSTRPAAAAPTPTTTINPAPLYGPSYPQLGAVPAAIPPTTTAKPSLPPPPKAGETLRAHEHHVASQALPTPPQMSQSSLEPGPDRVTPTKLTSSSTAAPSTNLPTSTTSSTQLNLEHPPGYVQNPYASDMTPDQRFAAEHEGEKRSGTSPLLGYNDNVRKRADSMLDGDGSVVEAAVKWGKEKGKQLGEFHQTVWDSIGRK